MIRHLILALALAAGVSSAAQAQTADVVQVCGATSGVVSPLGPGGRLTRDVNGGLCVSGVSGGGGGSGGAVTQGTSPWVVSGNSNPNTASNPIFTQVTNFPASQTVSGTVAVSNFPATQPISAASLPLPTGAATAANQNSTAAGTSATNAQAVQGVTGGVPLPIQGGNATAVKTDGSATTQPISAATLPLPTGAASATNQATGNSSLASIATNTTGVSTAANQASEIAQLTAANQRSVLFADFTNQAVAANGTITGAWHDAGASPSAYTKFNYAFVSNQTGTAVVQVSNDGTNSLTNILTTSALSPTNNIVGTLPLTYRYYRVILINGSGSTAANVSINTAFATN